MDGTDRLHRFRTWPTARAGGSLDYVKMMDLGADGVFIDNCGRRPPAARLTVSAPEFEPYVHGPVPERLARLAWGRFLEAVRVVKLWRRQDRDPHPDRRSRQSAGDWVWGRLFSLGLGEAPPGKREGGQGQPVVSGGRPADRCLGPLDPRRYVKDRSGLSPPDGRFHPLADRSHEVEFSTAFVSAGSGACQE